jgi:predicted permease
MLRRAVLWLRANLRRGRYEREMRSEMEEHLDRAMRLLMERGLPEDEARRQAAREFGDIAYHQTYARYARGTLWLDDLKADSRFAVRHFGRRPGTTIMMFIVLVFGMTISTLLFSWVHGLSVQPPSGITREDDLVRIRGTSDDGSVELDTRHFEEDEFFAYRNLTDHFAAVAGWIDRDGVLQIAGDAERRGHQADLMFVTENYFQVLGVQLILGAGLPTDASNDPTANAVAVVDHQTWQELLGQRRDILGSVVTINGVAMTIVGVAPDRFNGAGSKTGIQVWLPVSAQHLVHTNPFVAFSAVARLRPGVTKEAATAAVQTVAARVDTTGSDGIRGPSAAVMPLLAANHSPEFDSDIPLIALMLGLLGTIVLLVTCTNVSALLTGLASARRQEIAVRLSLGAARSRIIRQLLTESAVLAVVAGAAALALVALLLRTAQAVIRDLPLDMKVDWPTTAFTFAIALAVGVLFGLAPALHATRLALASVLRDSSGGIASARARLQRGLVVAQVAFTQPLIVLMVSMLVLITSDLKPVTRSDYADRVITLRVQTPVSVSWEYTPESERKQRDLMLRLRDQVRAIPGVENAVIEQRQLLPGVYTVHADDIAGDSSPATARLAVQRAEAAHFAALGIPMKSGRTFNHADVTAVESAAEAPVIIGADLASHLWGEADAIGRRLQLAGDLDYGTVPRVAEGLRTLVVIGVVDDPMARTRAVAESHRVYLPVDTAASAEFMLIRTVGAAAPLLPTIRGLVQNAAASTIIDARTMAQVEAELNSSRRRVSGAFSAAGIAALLLSAIGLYAVIAFSVSQRTQEIAVRIAVGARGSQIAYQFVRDGVLLGAFGLILGLPAGLFAMRQIRPIFDVGQMPVAPIILIASTGLFLVAAASAWGPARRAAAVDPATALRRG